MDKDRDSGAGSILAVVVAAQWPALSYLSFSFSSSSLSDVLGGL